MNDSAVFVSTVFLKALNTAVVFMLRWTIGKRSTYFQPPQITLSSTRHICPCRISFIGQVCSQIKSGILKYLHYIYHSWGNEYQKYVCFKKKKKKLWNTNKCSYRSLSSVAPPLVEDLTVIAHSHGVKIWKYPSKLNSMTTQTDWKRITRPFTARGWTKSQVKCAHV